MLRLSLIPHKFLTFEASRSPGHDPPIERTGPTAAEIDSLRAFQPFSCAAGCPNIPSVSSMRLH